MSSELSPAAEAYVWGFPLLSVHRTRSLFCSRTDTGALNHVDELATPADKGIVAPNNDTLYSSGWYDLRHGDLTVNVPPMDHADRYWNVMVLDAYTHVAYVCRRHHGVQGTRVCVTFDPSTPPRNDRSDVLTIGTPTVWIIIRVLVESPEDIMAARKMQRSVTVDAPTCHPHERTVRGERATTIGNAGAAVFSELKRCVKIDAPAPWHPQLSQAAKAIVDDPSSESDETLAAGVAEGERHINGRNVAGTVIENNWSTGRDATGFGNSILKRAVGAKFGLGGHQAIENRSYIAQGDANGNRLDGRLPLRLRMEPGAMPPCTAFWSLTAYGMDLYLVENELDRWSLSDRTPGLLYGEDGSLTIVLSATRPPVALTGGKSDAINWLPVPEGPYMLGLRVYEGTEEVVACRWFPPPLAPVTRARV